jgi:hypothetical protein
MIKYAKKLLKQGKLKELSILLGGLPESQKEKVEKAIYS